MRGCWPPWVFLVFVDGLNGCHNNDRSSYYRSGLSTLASGQIPVFRRQVLAQGQDSLSAVNRPLKTTSS